MRNIISTYVDRFRHERKTRIHFATILLLLALAVVAVVFWQLHYTGVAQVNDTYCGMEEHTHTEDCYGQVLSCGLEETEGHTHDESCYSVARVLACGLEESAGHAHSDACYEEQTVLICGLAEEEPHIHDESCYESVLVCDIPEHTHTVLCMTDGSTDVETAADWEATLPDEEELTGIWADDVILIAQSQLGYEIGCISS